MIEYVGTVFNHLITNILVQAWNGDVHALRFLIEHGFVKIQHRDSPMHTCLLVDDQIQECMEEVKRQVIAEDQKRDGRDNGG